MMVAGIDALGIMQAGGWKNLMRSSGAMSRTRWRCGCINAVGSASTELSGEAGKLFR